MAHAYATQIKEFRLTIFTTVITSIAVIYICICAFMYFSQTSLIFPSNFAPKSLNPEFTVFTTSDGTKLESKILNANPNNKNAPVVVLFTGNAQNAMYVSKSIYEAFNEKFNVATINYRSYGQSEGTPSEKFIFSDSLEFTKMIKQQFKNQKIYIMGISLGSGVASYISSKETAKGVILMVPFDSIENVAQSKYSWLPVKYLLKHKFNSVKHLKNVTTPIAIMRAENDKTINAIHTQILEKSVKNVSYSFVHKGMGHTQILQAEHSKELSNTLKNAVQSFETIIEN